MERTKAFKAPRSGSLQFHIPPNDINDVRSVSNIVNFLAWQKRQWKTRAQEKRVFLISAGRIAVKGK